MKKFIVFVVVVVLVLSTFKYHLGQIPVVDAYANHYFFQYFDKRYYGPKLDLAKTSSPLVAKVLILSGAEVNQDPSSTRFRRDASPLSAQIKEYSDCTLHLPEHQKDKIKECQENHLEIIEILLDNGADRNDALFQTRHVPVLTLLLKYGADIEERNQQGVTPLFYQTKNMQRYNSHNRSGIDSRAFEFLITQGADIHAKDKNGQTLLHVSRYGEIITPLINRGLDVNARDKYGNTPIFYRAADLNEPRALKTLVENGADIHIKNNEGKTALEHILQSKRYPNTLNKNAAYLLKKGAEINDEIYANALHITKPQKLPDATWTQKMLAMYADINRYDEYGIHAVTHKMELYKVSLDFDIVRSMEYLVNYEFIKKVIASYDKDIRKVHNRLGDTPLHYVVRYSDELTDYFIKEGVDVNSLNNQGQPPLFFAENLTTATKLIDHGADIYIKDKENKSALDYIKNPELLNFLMAKGANVQEKDSRQRTPLMNYIQKNGSRWIRTADDGLKFDKHYAAIKVFLNNGADINERLPDRNETMLFYINDTKLLNQLMKDGIDIEARDKKGQTALFRFLRFPLVEVGKALIRKGANVNVADHDKNRPLHLVLDDNLARMMIDKGADVNSKNINGDTPLHLLVQQNQTFSGESKHKTFDLFIRKGANTDSRNNKGQTPLMAAVMRGNRYYIDRLIEAGADTELKDNEGNTVLHYASQGTRNKEFIKYILDKDFDIDINTKNKKGQTMLDYTYNQSAKNYLIKQGALFGQYR